MCKELQTNIYIANNKYTVPKSIIIIYLCKLVTGVKMFALTSFHNNMHLTHIEYAEVHVRYVAL